MTSEQAAPFLSEILGSDEMQRLYGLFLIFSALDVDIRNIALILAGLQGKYPDSDLANDLGAARVTCESLSGRYWAYANTLHLEATRRSTQPAEGQPTIH